LRILLWGRFLIVLGVFGWADSINERDEADGGGLGGLDQPAAGRDRLFDGRERLGGLLRYYYRDTESNQRFEFLDTTPWLKISRLLRSKMP
jgi:hypothetical protein